MDQVRQVATDAGLPVFADGGMIKKDTLVKHVVAHEFGVATETVDEALAAPATSN